MDSTYKSSGVDIHAGEETVDKIKHLVKSTYSSNVLSGIGHFGLSGNVIRKPEGAAIILGSVITEAELTPTEPLSEDENYCDDCRMCQAACASEFMSPIRFLTLMISYSWSASFSSSPKIFA